MGGVVVGPRAVLVRRGGPVEGVPSAVPPALERPISELTSISGFAFTEGVFSAGAADVVPPVLREPVQLEVRRRRRAQGVRPEVVEEDDAVRTQGDDGDGRAVAAPRLVRQRVVLAGHAVRLRRRRRGRGLGLAPVVEVAPVALTPPPPALVPRGRHREVRLLRVPRLRRHGDGGGVDQETVAAPAQDVAEVPGPVEASAGVPLTSRWPRPGERDGWTPSASSSARPGPPEKEHGCAQSLRCVTEGTSTPWAPSVDRARAETLEPPPAGPQYPTQRHSGRHSSALTTMTTLAPQTMTHSLMGFCRRFYYRTTTGTVRVTTGKTGDTIADPVWTPTQTVLLVPRESCASPEDRGMPGRERPGQTRRGTSPRLSRCRLRRPRSEDVQVWSGLTPGPLCVLGGGERRHRLSAVSCKHQTLRTFTKCLSLAEPDPRGGPTLKGQWRESYSSAGRQGYPLCEDRTSRVVYGSSRGQSKGLVRGSLSWRTVRMLRPQFYPTTPDQ